MPYFLTTFWHLFLALFVALFGPFLALFCGPFCGPFLPPPPSPPPPQNRWSTPPKLWQVRKIFCKFGKIFFRLQLFCGKFFVPPQNFSGNFFWEERNFFWRNMSGLTKRACCPPPAKLSNVAILAKIAPPRSAGSSWKSGLPRVGHPPMRSGSSWVEEPTRRGWRGPKQAQILQKKCVLGLENGPFGTFEAFYCPSARTTPAGGRCDIGALYMIDACRRSIRTPPSGCVTNELHFCVYDKENYGSIVEDY